ncbi:MAG: helix-turn-helix domain-containing protein [Porphyromonas sp.]|nr:helix-turn-helix domain-containing protein [Porphyromonas sp.]
MVDYQGEVYYTSEEVCDLIGYTRSTLMKRVQAGKVKQIIVKRTALFKKEEIDMLCETEDHMLYSKRRVVRWTPKELSELLGVSISTIYRWVREEKVEVERVGRFLIFTEENLEKIISELEKKCQQRGEYVNEKFRTI